MKTNKFFGSFLVYTLIVAGNGSIANANEAHDKFQVLDLKLGMPTENRPGFVCTTERWTQSKERIEPVCVKFLDDKCKGKKSSIGSMRYGQTAPKGCNYDIGRHSTYLDNIMMQDPHTGAADQPRNGRKPLNNVVIWGTKSEPSKIYRIEYMLAEDDIKSKDSKIYKALVAKYGEPTYPEHSGKIKWKMDGVELIAECPPHVNCQISVEDRNFETLENKEQEEIDKKKKSDSAPAPEL